VAAYIKGFGSYVPSRVVRNDEIGAQVGCDADWILNVSGIEQRRFAEPGETVADLATRAAADCLERSRVKPSDLGMIVVSTGTSERHFPGPAATVAYRLGLADIPAIDLPVASAGTLFGMALGAQFASRNNNILVIGAEKMSEVVQRPPMERAVAILFGDGAGACLIGSDPGRAEIVDWALQSDGTFTEDLRLEYDQPLSMNGRSVILQASRKIPRAISTVLERQGRAASDVDVFLMHQANQNLMNRIAQTLEIPANRFYSNIQEYGNTSSASMLIAAAAWEHSAGFRPGLVSVFTAFGAGFHWGALLAVGV
jgi:3-oxoacyl-[acyl-carrier-protein] synthase-3